MCEGYDVNNLIGLPYDWRLSPKELESRDSFFTNLKFKIETAVKRHRRPAIIIAHSMGNNLLMYFCNWLRYESKPSMGWEKWIRMHIWAHIGFAAPLLGSPGSLKSVLSGHPLGLTISEMQAREMELTVSSTHLVNPRSCFAPKDVKFTGQCFADFIDPIVSFRSASGSSNMTFGIRDIENGEIFRLAGNIYSDQLLLDKFSSLHELYIKDPLRPLHNQYERLPIRHVIMVYGIDVPTEVGYSYNIPDMGGVGVASAVPRAPELDEIYVEEPCGSCSVADDNNCPDNYLSESKEIVSAEDRSSELAKKMTGASAISRDEKSPKSLTDGGENLQDTEEQKLDNVQLFARDQEQKEKELLVDSTGGDDSKSDSVQGCGLNGTDSPTHENNTEGFLERSRSLTHHTHTHTRTLTQTHTYTHTHSKTTHY